MPHPIKAPRKLIEVALPLDAINAACGREKSIRHGHPSTLHLWWARRPLAAARAVIFAQLVNDPGFQQGGGFRYGKNKKEAAVERKRLFKIIEDLVKWESTTNEEVLERARAEIRRSWREVCELNKDHPQAAEMFDPEVLPGFHDPFAGGGTLPLEAQRLGLKAFASDLNPVAVVINKAMIEIPPRFAGKPPVNPDRQAKSVFERTIQSFSFGQGVAEDVRYYGAWIRDLAEKRIGQFYPQVTMTESIARDRPDLTQYIGKKVTVIGWLWARTVRSPNPAFAGVEVPLASSFMLASKAGTEAYVEPLIKAGSYSFAVRVGKPNGAEAVEAAKNGTKLARANFVCLMSGSPISPQYIKAEGKAGRMRSRLMAVVAEGERTKLYLPPTVEMENAARDAQPNWKPDLTISGSSQYLGVKPYGIETFCQLFTDRQLLALTTFSDLIREAGERIRHDALSCGFPDDARPLAAGGDGAIAYAEAIQVFLSFAISRMADRHSTLCRWDPNPSGYSPKIANTFGRQAFPMVWDYIEGNPFSPSSGNLTDAIGWVAKVIDMSLSANTASVAAQSDARLQSLSDRKVVSTDPPYYDNVPYADLSDFFYVWLRRSLKSVFPDLFATLAVPKAEELVAFAHRHDGKASAEAYFLDGMTQAMHRVAEQAHPAFPVTIYYAFKQAETNVSEGTVSTGWETFLDAVIRAGFAIVGTWPMRTELSNRMRGNASNALASSIVLVCRKHQGDATTISRREFVRELNAVLPEALDEMTKGAGDDREPVAPVDLSQAIIGPGMAVFSKYSAVLEADGTPMSVRTALQLINRFLAADDFDADTQFCLRWFEQHNWRAGKFGDADTLARAKGTAVEGVMAAGVIESGGGNVRLLKWAEYPVDWDPKTDTRNPVWETLHHLIRALRHDGESGAGRLLAAVKAQTEPARQLAYRLYTLCERQGWAEDARAYNELITSWTAIETAAGAVSIEPAQGKLFD